MPRISINITEIEYLKLEAIKEYHGKATVQAVIRLLIDLQYIIIRGESDEKEV